MTEAFWYFGITIALSFFIVLLSSLPRIIRYGLRRIQCHIGSINMRLRWDSKHGPTVQFLVSDIIHYLIWFEVDKIGGYPSPLPDGDLELCSLLEGKHRRTKRFPIEEWPERRRLLMTAVGETSVTTRMRYLFSTTEPTFDVQLRRVRIHLPSSTPEINVEQKLLYPNGYPNLVLPLYQLLVRFSGILKLVFPWILRNVDVEIHELEAHGLPDISAFGSAPQANLISWLAPVQVFGSAVRETREYIQDLNIPRDVINLRKERFISAYIDRAAVQCVTMLQSEKSPISIRSKFYNIKVMVGTNECSGSIAENLYPCVARVAEMESTVQLGHVQHLPDGLSKDLSEKLSMTHYTPVPIAEEPLTYALPSHCQVHISTPLWIEPDFLSAAIYAVKNVTLTPSQEVNQHGWMKQILRVGADLYWDGLGLGDLVSGLTAQAISSAVDGVNRLKRPIQLKNDVLLWF